MHLADDLLLVAVWLFFGGIAGGALVSWHYGRKIIARLDARPAAAELRDRDRENERVHNRLLIAQREIAHWHRLYTQAAMHQRVDVHHHSDPLPGDEWKGIGGE